MMMIILHILFLLPSVTSLCPLIYAERLFDYDDKKISQNVIRTMTGLSKTECIHQCYNETFCNSVHFNPSGSSCSCLRERFKDISVSTVPEIGHTLFQLRKPDAAPGSDCEEDLDCASLPNSQCHEARCRCDQGYDEDGARCRILSECTSFNTNFTRYERSVLVGYDIAATGATNAEGCKQLCLDNPVCISCDHDHVGRICYQHIVKWTEVPAGVRETNSPIFDYYERGCNW